ncbi:carbohydrate-binding protein [uncultured Aquimarina sp.]|uniref:galactose-binding domain-containing protein n=1 Tax=uncultured Aquimarina sp. TaxID=575652 RepID=UPI002604602D|nr:carbohydrate-binding protein [uncultured Aquimarina sp.]
MKYSYPIRKTLLFLLFNFIAIHFIEAQMVHPGISHKKSDLDRIKYMVEAQIDPWYTSYQNMIADSKASFRYTVQGDESFTILARDSPRTNYGAWNSDIRAAYYNAIRWYITEDPRHAEKAIEIFKAWSNLTSVTSNGTEALSGGVGYIMIEAAEIIKSTYSEWKTSDMQKFKDMLVYPGYSATTVPNDIRSNSTFYWSSYQGDPGRHGNQGLSGWRTVMAMGIFLDNEIMYDRALRYIKGQSHRSDDLSYPSGPRTHTDLIDSGDHADTYNTSQGNSITDYGYNEVMTHYIYETGQCQESSRDQAHVLFGLGLLNSMAEMAWNQGDDLYSHENDRLLLGLEYSLRYNVSSVASYPDQNSPWEPNTFLRGFDRTERWYSKSISPDGRGDFTRNRPNWEMSTAHYIGRGFKSENEAKWTLRARDKSIDIDGYERAGWTNDAIGWGGLTFRRPIGCHGDPISGFIAGLPDYNMNVLPMTIEAENYDYSPTNGEGRTYHDTSANNSGNQYRTNENVDIETRTGGGYNIGWIASGEWLTYTVYVPETGNYDIAINYAANNTSGKIKFEFGGSDKTGEIPLTGTGGMQSWNDLTVKTGVRLSKGVQNMKVLASGVSNSFNLNSIKISKDDDHTDGRNNLALSGTATQSSTNQVHGGAAPRAIDNNTNGRWSEDSVTHTETETNPWWQVDLESSYNIDEIIVFNRTDCCANRLSNYTVSVINSNGDTTFSKSFTSAPDPSITVNAEGATGKIIKVQINGTGVLSMAEVQVYGEAFTTGGGNFQLVKRNATGFAIDGGSGAVAGRSIELYTNVQHNNLVWTEIDRGGGYYSYQKYNTNVCLDGGSGGANGQDVTLQQCDASDYGQQWQKIDAGSGHYRLQKRGTNYSLDGNHGGDIDQNVYLWTSSSTNQNQQWRFDKVESSRSGAGEIKKTNLNLYPIPLSDVLHVSIDGSKTAKIDIFNSAGQTVYTEQIENGVGSISLGHLPIGLYIAKITNGKVIINRKILIKK